MAIRNTIAAALALVAPLTVGSAPAQAGGDAIIAGAVGFGVGTLFGSAISTPRYVMAPPVYVAPEPVYVMPPPTVVYQSAPVYYATPAPWTVEWYSFCDSRYRSFDPRDGSYVGVDGRRYMCR